MKILADESVEAIVVRALRQAGYDTEFVLEISPGISDVEVLNQALKNKRFVITSDKDFGELVVKSKSAHHGVLLYRLSGLGNERKAEMIVEVIQKKRHELEGNFSVINLRHLRIRKLKS